MKEYIEALTRAIVEQDHQVAELWDDLNFSSPQEHEECIRRVALGRGRIQGLEQALDVLQECLAECQKMLGG